MLLKPEFQAQLNKLSEKQSKLKEEKQAIKKEALSIIVGIIKEFEVTFEDLAPYLDRRSDTGSKKKIKYRTPTGIEWTGMGSMKKAFKIYLEEHNLSEKDIEQFRVKDE